MTPKYYIIAVVAFFCFSVSTTTKANLGSTGDIKLIEALKIEELDRLNFGTIERPTQKVWVGVRKNGTSEGTATMLDTASVKNGKVKITGSNNDTINLKATDLNTYPDISFRRIRGQYNNSILFLKSGESNVTPPTTSGTEMKLYSRIWVEANIATGDYEPAFQIEVNYD